MYAVLSKVFVWKDLVLVRRSHAKKTPLDGTTDKMRISKNLTGLFSDTTEKIPSELQRSDGVTISLFEKGEHDRPTYT